MKSLYDAKLPKEKPQTHVLIIGVNSYPHLIGGEQEDTNPAPLHFGLTQLTSPVVSAEALTNWLLTEHNNPSAPLGSLELALSPAIYKPSDEAASKLGVELGAIINVEEAKFAPIKEAAARWFAQANRHRDNVALFYFCGHGLEASDRYLLPSDFGASPDGWTDNIINLTMTYNKMAYCRAKTQCFFIDACRDRPDELRDLAISEDSIGKSLIGDLVPDEQKRDRTIYHAAMPGESAVGPPHKESYFTSALLKCLKGMGARAQNGSYAPVDQGSLSTALRELIDRLAKDEQLLLSCDVLASTRLPLSAELHRAQVPVEVLTIVQCEPEDAQGVAQLSLVDSEGITISRKKFSEQPWKLIVKAGKCSVEAKFDSANPFLDSAGEVIIGPPVCPLPLLILLR